MDSILSISYSKSFLTSICVKSGGNPGYACTWFENALTNIFKKSINTSPKGSWWAFWIILSYSSFVINSFESVKLNLSILLWLNRFILSDTKFIEL